MEYQQTTTAKTVISGKALFNGQLVTMCLYPQPENTGIVFQRSDLPGKPSIKANGDAVISTNRHMTIGKDGWSISTIEHLMAVFHALGIDNILVEVSGEELPVGDGGGRLFAEEILKVGLTTQNAPRKYVVVQEPVWVDGIVHKHGAPSKATLLILPSEQFEVDFTFTSDHRVTGTQYFHYVASPDSFLNEIAPARTIGFVREIEYMQSQGLGLGGNLDCVVVVGEDKYENELRFSDEIVRHKILDVLGDLYLLGPLKGRVIAIRSGHSLDLELVKKIVRQNKALLV